MSQVSAALVCIQLLGLTGKLQTAGSSQAQEFYSQRVYCSKHAMRTQIYDLRQNPGDTGTVTDVCVSLVMKAAEQAFF